MPTLGFLPAWITGVSPTSGGATAGTQINYTIATNSTGNPRSSSPPIVVQDASSYTSDLTVSQLG
jgi:hypothetical protein